VEAAGAAKLFDGKSTMASTFRPCSKGVGTMAALAWAFFYLAVTTWVIGIPWVIARCNLRNGIPASFGWWSWQTASAMRKFNKQDWRYFCAIVVGSFVFIALAFAFGFPGTRV
jgi:hypothetical protein